MNSQFHIIDKSTWERSVYFDYYYNQIKCKYNLNANLDITRLVAVVPSYTLFHPNTKTFTDIWSEYSEDFDTFYQTIVADIEAYRNVTGVIKARPGQPANFCPVSCLPWLSYTAFAQDTYTESKLLFPLIKFGKYFEADGRIQIPVSVFVSHAVADGYHTCKLINDMQEIAEACLG